MLIKKIPFLLIPLLLLSLILPAQHQRGVCGVSYEDQISQLDRYITNKKTAATFPSKSRNSVTYIPVQFHIITKNDGSGATKLTDLLESFCHLNEIYGAFDVVFFQNDLPNYLASDVIYNDHTITSAQFSMRTRRNREALNIWVVNDATPANSPNIGQTLGYYDPVNDWIIIRRNQISGNNNTLAHEVGHFFSLFHPHLGWDSEPYDDDIHGNPVNATSPGGSPTELMDRSNCETAGDMLCDTPPDYNFALTWNECNFTAKIQDPNGDEVDPDESLIMSYFNDACTSKFSDMQLEMILADISSPGRNFLTINDYQPIATTITETPELLAPAQDAVTSSYNKVYLKWAPVAGADSYLVEVDRSSSFNIDNFKFLTTETTFLLEDLLDSDRTYRWRITPLNASYFCSPPSVVIKFRTGISTSTTTINAVNNWTVQPNPLLDASVFTVNINAKESFEANLKILNLNGQVVSEKPRQQFSQGLTTLPMNAAGLAKGVYIIALENTKGVMHKKLVIQ